MSEQELTDYEAKKYENPRTAPRDNDRISRNNRLVRLTDKMETILHQGEPEDLAALQELYRAVQVIDTVERQCIGCGAAGTVKQIRNHILETLCEACAPPPPRGWVDDFPELWQTVWRLRCEGLKLREISARLANQYQRLTVPRISEMLDKMQRRRKECHHAKVRQQNQ
jgi:hypothetical protein